MRVLSVGHVVAFLLLLLLATVEGVYGRTDYSQDAVCYLTQTRAIHAGEWKLAANSVWSVGYPALIAIAESFWQSDPMTERKVIFGVNIAIFAFTYLSFLFLLSRLKDTGRMRGLLTNHRSAHIAYWIAISVFVAIELTVGRASRISPDMLVACLFYLSVGLILSVQENPSYRKVLLLGMLLGVGYVVKAVYLPIAFVSLAVVWVVVRRQKRAVLLWAFCGAGVLAFALPYCAALSWSAGRFTTGTAGVINYAANVDRMPALYWQGGPERLGSPLHPVHQLLRSPAMYAYGEPFRVTYPPMFERFYFVEGAHDFFSPWLQARAIARNGIKTLLMIAQHPIFWAWLLVNVILFCRYHEQRRVWRIEIARLWPAWIMAMASIGIYLIVVVEPRYLPGFMVVLLAAPLIAFANTSAILNYKVTVVLGVIALLGLMADLGISNISVIQRVIHSETSYNDRSWRLGLSLRRYGLAPGSQVGVIVHDTGAYASWAYVGNVNIVAELIEPGEVRKSSVSDVENDYWDYPNSIDPATLERTFWQLSADEQNHILNLFREAGATAVVSLSKPVQASHLAGWIEIKESGSWLYRL